MHAPLDRPSQAPSALGRALPRAVLLALLVAGLSGALAPRVGADEEAAKAEKRRRSLAAQFDRGERFAVVVGVNQFDDKSLSTLRFCVADARLVAEVLVTRCAYPKDNVVLLGDGEAAERLPTRENILRELTATLRRVKPLGTVLVYFATHGGPIRGQSELCPRDYDSREPGLTGIRVDTVREMLYDSKAAQKLLVIDACHSGGVKSGTGVDLPLGGEDLEGGGGSGGLITFAAARKSQTSVESPEKRHGIFTYSLAHGLAGAADADRDAIVDSDELYRYVHAEVGALARKLGTVQTPVRILGEDVTGVFALARVGAGREFDTDLKAGQLVTNSIGMEFSLVMPAPWRIGSPPDESGRNPDEFQAPAPRGVPILMGRREVTQAEYEAVTGKNPSWFRRGGEGAAAVGDLPTERLPVEQVTWEDAVAFCHLLSKLPAEVAAKRGYRLPLETEWEFACRAGTSTPFHVGSRISPNEANVDGSRPYLDSPALPGLGRTAPVGSYPPNAFGLFDFHGNVWEWCSSWYVPTYPVTIGEDWNDPASGQRVVRGGAYAGDVALARSASRRGRDPSFAHRSIGFRVVCFGKELENR